MCHVQKWGNELFNVFLDEVMYSVVLCIVNNWNDVYGPYGYLEWLKNKEYTCIDLKPYLLCNTNAINAFKI